MTAGTEGSVQRAASPRRRAESEDRIAKIVADEPRFAGDWVGRHLPVIRPEPVRGKADPGWLFVSKSGEKLDGESVRQTAVKAAARAGIERTLGPDAFRRACATEPIRRNADPRHVKELLGYEDFRSLDVYTKLTILDLKAAHAKYHPREGGGSPANDPGPGLK